jgi:hypothetical protein
VRNRTAILALLLVAGCTSSNGTAGPSAPSITSLPAASPTSPASDAASPSASPSASPGPTAPPLNPCPSVQLRLSIGTTEGGAGQFHQRLVVTNRGAPCSLHGYPGVSFLDDAGNQLGDPADMNAATVRRVFLAAGGSASAVLTYSNAGAFPDSTCRPKQASRVRVYPPGQRLALTAADGVLVCSAHGSRQLHIDPMEPGTG